MLFTFPSRYLFTIGLRSYSALADGPAGFTQGSTCPALLRITVGFGKLRARGSHPLRPGVPAVFRPLPLLPCTGPTTPGGPEPPRFGLVPVRSPLLGESLSCFLFLQVLRCFSSLRSPPQSYMRVTVLQTAGLPHSDTRGSRAACASPRIFAACRVLRRLAEPRHPPMRPCPLAPRTRKPGTACLGTMHLVSLSLFHNGLSRCAGIRPACDSALLFLFLVAACQ